MLIEITPFCPLNQQSHIDEMIKSYVADNHYSTIVDLEETDISVRRFFLAEGQVYIEIDASYADVLRSKCLVKNSLNFRNKKDLKKFPCFLRTVRIEEFRYLNVEIT